MPTASVANFEGDELLSARLLSFIANNEQSTTPVIFETTGVTGSGGSNYLPPTIAETENFSSNTTRSPITRDGSIPSLGNPHDRPPPMLNGYSFASHDNTASTGFLSGSCTPPPTVISGTSIPSTFLSMRNHQTGHPPYSALTSPCLGNKLNTGSTGLHMLPLNGTSGECHSLQNSPFYNHYPVNGGGVTPSQFARPLNSGVSPGPLISGGLSAFNSRNNGGIYGDSTTPYTLNGLHSSVPTCPQRELFPSGPPGSHNQQNVFGSVLLAQDRLHYHALAQKHGFIVGPELERVKENSCRSTSQSYGRIAAHFRHRYGETEAKTKAAYLQIGVRVPSKDHVSEIVGKGGQKIKLIREETGALITTPGEHEEHVFIIEAPPEIAMRVAHHLTTRAQEITQSKVAAGERRRGSTSSQPNDNGYSNNSGGGATSSSTLGNGNGPSNGNGGLLNGSCNNHSGFVFPNGTGGSGLLSSIGGGTSNNNSPLHPVTGALNPVMLTGNNNNNTGTGTSLRTPTGGGTNGSMFGLNLSSLPNSPCSNGNISQLQSGGGNGGAILNGTSGQFGSGNNATPVSRTPLARGRISVPQEMVGKIIGTQGSIITTIQKDTGTEIKSPPKEAARGPNATSEFEISAYQSLGLSSVQAAECRVQQAKQLIGHLVMRQLERRASEETDDGITGTNVTTDDQRTFLGGNPGPGGNSPRGALSTWMWPDVAQMDLQEAREVLDRILAESKNKTRRAKELAAAAAVSAGPSPTSMSMLTNHGSITGGADISSAPLLEQHFNPHLMGHGMYDNPSSGDSVDCCNGFVSGRDFGPHPRTMTGDHQQQGNVLSSATFSCSIPGHYVNRAYGNNMLDDFPSTGSNVTGSRTANFNLPDSSEVRTTFNRAPGRPTMNQDQWNSRTTFTTVTSCPSVGDSLLCTNHFRTALTSNPAVTTTIMNSLFNTGCTSNSPHEGSFALDSTVRANTSVHRGSRIQSEEFEETSNMTNIFNFNDTNVALGFSTGGDLSPGLLLRSQTRSSQHTANVATDGSNSLLRRNNDWGVGQYHHHQPTLTDYQSNRTGLDRTTSEQRSDDLENAFKNGGSFDFIKALDNMCLNSPPPGPTVPIIGSNSSSGGSSGNPSGSHNLIPRGPPPGFEEQSQQQQHMIDRLLSMPTSLTEVSRPGFSSALADPWSNNIDPSTGSFFLSAANSRGSHRDLLSSDENSGDNLATKTSLLQRLFNGEANQQTSSSGLLDSTSTFSRSDRHTAHLNSIWSRSACGSNETNDSSIKSHNNYSNIPEPNLGESQLDVAAALVSQLQLNCVIDNSPGLREEVQSEIGAPSCTKHDEQVGRCGAVGDGRKRRNLLNATPSLSASTTTQSSSSPPIAASTSVSTSTTTTSTSEAL